MRLAHVRSCVLFLLQADGIASNFEHTEYLGLTWNSLVTYRVSIRPSQSPDITKKQNKYVRNSSNNSTAARKFGSAVVVADRLAIPPLLSACCYLLLFDFVLLLLRSLAASNTSLSAPRRLRWACCARR